MVCMECGAKAEKGNTTSVSDLGNCLLIVRNVPCYKCTECNEIIYTGNVIKRLEQIKEQAKQFTNKLLKSKIKLTKDTIYSILGNCESRIPGGEFEQIVPDFISGNYLNTKIPLKDVDWT